MAKEWKDEPATRRDLEAVKIAAQERVTSRPPRRGRVGTSLTEIVVIDRSRDRRSDPE